MSKISRTDIHLINTYSNWTKESLSAILRRHVYPDRQQWKLFLQLFIITLGVGFTVAGIVFFFAYNWNGLHRFLKLGIVESLIVISLILTLISGQKRLVRKIIGTAAPALVGVLLLVYGQVYQTSALEYEFFLQWVLFISIWVFVSGFPHLWLLFLILVHITIIFYMEQAQKNSSPSAVYALLSGLDCAAYFLNILLLKWRKAKIPLWFLQCVAIGTAIFATMGISNGIHHEPDLVFALLCTGTLIVYAFGVDYGLRQKSSFLLSLISLSVIIIIASIMLKISESQSMILVTGLFIILSVTAVIKMLSALQNRKENG